MDVSQAIAFHSTQLVILQEQKRDLEKQLEYNKKSIDSSVENLTEALKKRNSRLFSHLMRGVDNG